MDPLSEFRAVLRADIERARKEILLHKLNKIREAIHGKCRGEREVLMLEHLMVLASPGEPICRVNAAAHALTRLVHGTIWEHVESDIASLRDRDSCLFKRPSTDC